MKLESVLTSLFQITKTFKEWVLGSELRTWRLPLSAVLAKDAKAALNYEHHSYCTSNACQPDYII